MLPLPTSFILMLGKLNRPSVPQVPPRRGRSSLQSAHLSWSVSGVLCSRAPSTCVCRFTARVLHNHITLLCSQRWKDHSIISLPRATFLCPLPNPAQYFTWYFTAVYFISLSWHIAWSWLISHLRLASFVTTLFLVLDVKAFVSCPAWGCASGKLNHRLPYQSPNTF